MGLYGRKKIRKITIASCFPQNRILAAKGYMEPVDTKAAIVQIRYNTESDGKNKAWRMIVDGQELLVNAIDIQTPSHTSSDWLADKQVFKHHITVPDCRVQVDKNGNATITGG